MLNHNLAALLSSTQASDILEVASAFHAAPDDASTNSTSIRLDYATLAFYDTLADKLGMSRNAVIQSLLHQLVAAAAQKQAVT